MIRLPGIQRIGQMSNGTSTPETPAVDDDEFLGNRPRVAKRTFSLGSPAFVVVAACLLLVSGCGGSGGPTLTAQGERGRDLAKGAGCTACHGDDGAGGVGPAWVGLADSIVELDDGRTAVADTDFLIRSIKEPNVDQTATYTLLMPANSLTDDEVAAVVTYIQELK